MIDKEILDEVLPVPELEELKEQKIEELQEEGFVVTNFHSGGIFYTRRPSEGRADTRKRPSFMTSIGSSTTSSSGATYAPGGTFRALITRPS